MAWTPTYRTYAIHATKTTVPHTPSFLAVPAYWQSVSYVRVGGFLTSEGGALGWNAYWVDTCW